MQLSIFRYLYSKCYSHCRTKNEGSFEEVRHNKASFGRQAEQRNQGSSQGVKLNLGNRYNTLSSTNDS